jgi:predicted DNA-binding protein with PD1-like motif
VCSDGKLSRKGSDASEENKLGASAFTAVKEQVEVLALVGDIALHDGNPNCTPMS